MSNLNTVTFSNNLLNEGTKNSIIIYEMSHNSVSNETMKILWRITRKGNDLFVNATKWKEEIEVEGVNNAGNRSLVI